MSVVRLQTHRETSAPGETAPRDGSNPTLLLPPRTGWESSQEMESC